MTPILTDSAGCAKPPDQARANTTVSAMESVRTPRLITDLLGNLRYLNTRHDDHSVDALRQSGGFDRRCRRPHAARSPEPRHPRRHAGDLRESGVVRRDGQPEGPYLPPYVRARGASR